MKKTNKKNWREKYFGEEESFYDALFIGWHFFLYASTFGIMLVITAAIIRRSL